MKIEKFNRIEYRNEEDIPVKEYVDRHKEYVDEQNVWWLYRKPPPKPVQSVEVVKNGAYYGFRIITFWYPIYKSVKDYIKNKKKYIYENRKV